MVAKASRVCRYLIVILCVFISTGAYAGVIQYFIGGWIGDGIGNIKIFIPGAIQLGCDQRGKAYGIIAAEVTTVAAGTIFWYLSDKSTMSIFHYLLVHLRRSLTDTLRILNCMGQ